MKKILFTAALLALAAVFGGCSSVNDKESSNENPMRTVQLIKTRFNK